jgi:hypothetical protein
LIVKKRLEQFIPDLGRNAGAVGSFVHRVAGTPHYDGVVRGHPEPAIIAICGMGPVNFALSDPSQPGVRRL